MEYFYPLFITFCIVFFSELGDKTQLLVLSFSTQNKAKNILLGVAIGTFFSHGIAILFGSNLALTSNTTIQTYLKIFTYFSFLLFGIFGFIFNKKEDTDFNSTSSPEKKDKKLSLIEKISTFKINYILIIAIAIIIGELGDKTFLASLGLSLQYPNHKLSLILGSILGMVLSNLLAIFFGKFISSFLKPSSINFLSNAIFIIFGVLGFISMFA